jgi:hypothetical protein
MANALQVYKKSDSSWLGEFRSINDIEQHMFREGEDINDYEIKLEASRYPTAN